MHETNDNSNKFAMCFIYLANWPTNCEISVCSEKPQKSASSLKKKTATYLPNVTNMQMYLWNTGADICAKQTAKPRNFSYISHMSNELFKGLVSTGYLRRM
jgi:hypothetical protein